MDTTQTAQASAPAHSAALFVFAHQDDEFGVFHRIEQCVRNGLRVHCLYLTDGAYRNATSAQRNRESLKVLTRLGVRIADITFAGEQAGIADGSLPERLPAARACLGAWLARFGCPDSIHIPAWEGGHQDHDALHAVATVLAQEQGKLPLLRQFPLYHGYGCIHPLLSALAPLPANGLGTAERVPGRARLRYLCLCLSYRSQARAWLLLFPFVLWRYLVNGRQELQPVQINRIAERPHPGKLYYERRSFYTWNRMQTRLREAFAL